jgi:hypothetical protein
LPAPDMPDLSKLTLLVCHERSGSHYLSSFIKALKQLAINEVCNDKVVDPDTNPYSYFGYLYKQAKEKPEYIQRRNSATVGALLDEYFAHGLELGNGKAVTLDIKYGHLHNFNPFWWPIYRTPFLFDYAGRRNIGVIHLSRWNSLETAISDQLASSRGVWHAVGERKEAGAEEAIKVDKKQLLSQITNLDEQKSAVAMWTRNLRSLQILYEELTDPILGDECRGRTAEFLGAKPPKDFVSPYRKVTPPLPVIASNWEEISDFCRSNRLTHYLLPLRMEG